MFASMIEHFTSKTPIGMMTRGLLERALSQSEIDQLFHEHAMIQYERKVLFSDITELLSVVVCRIRPSISAAIENWHRTLPAQRKAIYEKINHTEPQLGQHLVQHCATKLILVIDSLNARQASILPGYTIRIIDGNHHAKTDHRLKVLHNITAGPLPGFSLVVYDPAFDLVTHHFPCEDGHDSERNQLDAVLKIVQSDEVWIADRHFCTTGFLSGLIERDARFVIREHATNGPWKDETEWMFRGRVDTGEVWEQTVQLLRSDGSYQPVRRVKIVLDRPTRNGEKEIYILSNLPVEISALLIAEAYRKRWTIETSFQDIEANLRSEISTLNHPKAALFVFSIALVAFNIYRLVKTVIRAEYGSEVAAKISGYDVANEVAYTHHSVDIVIPHDYWQTLAGYSLQQFTHWLRELARQIPIARFTKFKQYPKKTKPKPVHDPKELHVSTYRKLQEKKQKKT